MVGLHGKVRFHQMKRTLSKLGLIANYFKVLLNKEVDRTLSHSHLKNYGMFRI